MVRRVDLMVRLCCSHKNLTKLREAEDRTHILPPSSASRVSSQIYLSELPHSWFVRPLPPGDPAQPIAGPLGLKPCCLMQ